MKKDPVVIVSAARTPIGGLLGDFKEISATALGSAALRATLERAGLPPDGIDEVYMGCVLSAGLGQAPARQAGLGAGLALATACTTVSKVCGSGLKAVMLAHDAIACGNANIALAGGMESMTGAPHLLPKSREGYRLGPRGLPDHMMLDGLEDAYEKNTAMGVFAERCALEYGFTREQQDAYALASLARARAADFSKEIIPVSIPGRKKETLIDTDELPRKADPSRIPSLRPVFAENGTVTAANASSISDGAASVALMRLSEAEKRGLAPLARIAAHASHAQEPARFSTAPVGAIRRLFDKTGWKKDNTDLFEINEAFAVVALACMQELDLPHEQVNIHGGACAMGHPIGASGARILVTLLHALEARAAKRGIAALCIGGGEAVAMAVERI